MRGTQLKTRMSDVRMQLRGWIPVLLLIVLGLYGCQTTPKTTFSTERPNRHSFATEHFVVQSDIRLEANDPLVLALQTIREDLISALQLPKQREPVKVYLFSDEVSYRYYMQATWRDLPPRRAYFVGTSRELAVYSFVSPHVLEDLRHEFTHGILHASLQTVPLWLDEGIAEYFEVDANVTERVSETHLQELSMAQSEGWSPGLYRLENIIDFRELTQRDYAECWAWVHFMLNSSPEAKDVLLKYIQTLQTTKTPRHMMDSIEKAVPSYVQDLQSHVQQLLGGAVTKAME